MGIVAVALLCGIVYGTNLHSHIQIFNNTDIKSLASIDKPTFAMFYNSHCEHCTNFNSIFNELSSYCLGHWPDVSFYTINGPGNPSLIMEFKELAVYPSFAYIAPMTMNLSQVYTGELTINELKNWTRIILNQHYNTEISKYFTKDIDAEVKEDCINCREEL